MKISSLQICTFFQEKLYTDKNFPEMGPNAKNLAKAPKDLGMSRADLWAFSGLVSLAWYQKNSRDLARLLKPTYVKTNLHLVSRNFLRTKYSNFSRLVVLIVIQEISMTSCTCTDLKVGSFIPVLDSMARGPWNTSKKASTLNLVKPQP